MIISDRGPQFASTLWKELLQSLGTRVALASPYHPQTDGQSERAIQTLLRMVQSYARTLPGEWVCYAWGIAVPTSKGKECGKVIKARRDSDSRGAYCHLMSVTQLSKS